MSEGEEGYPIEPKYPFHRAASYRYVQVIAKQLSTTESEYKFPFIPDRIIIVNTDATNKVKVNYDKKITSTEYDYIKASGEIKRDIEAKELRLVATGGTPTVCIITLAYTHRPLQ